MSEQNVELHRREIEAFNARDIQAFISLSDPQIEFYSAMTTPGGAVYHGRDGLRKWLGDLEDAWGDELRVEPEAFFDVGEHTLAFQVLHGRGRQSGAEVALPGAALARWREGLLVYLKVYLQREEALKDLGVSVYKVEPIAP